MRIVVASHELSTRSAIGMLIESQPDLELAGTAADVTDLLACIKNSRPELVVLDWEVLGQKIDTLVDLLQLFENPPPIVGLSVREEAHVAALSAGVAGFAYKGDPPSRLLETIRASAPQRSRGSQTDNEL
jgi:DNA-binding NarL/FixJ family response regulator